MPVAKEIKYITGVCCGAWSENIACLWQRIALKTASAWSVWNMSHCFHYKDFNVPVSFGKGLHLLWNKSKAPQMYCLLSGPAHESCASRSHCRGIRIMFILWVMSQVSQGVCMGPTPWQQRSARTWNVGTFGQHSCPAVQGHGSSPAQMTRDPAQVVLCCAGGPQGCGRMRRSQYDAVKPSRSVFPMGLIWFACRRQDFKTCAMHECRVIFVWCPLAFRSVNQC